MEHASKEGDPHEASVASAMVNDIMTKMGDIHWEVDSLARCDSNTYEQDGQQLDKIPLIELQALESKWIQKTTCFKRQAHVSKDS